MQGWSLGQPHLYLREVPLFGYDYDHGGQTILSDNPWSLRLDPLIPELLLISNSGYFQGVMVLWLNF